MSDIDQFLEDILLHMMISKPKLSKSTLNDPVPLNYFSPAFVLKESSANTDDDNFYFADATEKDISDLRLDDLCILSDHSKNPDANYQIARPRYMTHKELRGLPLQGRKVIKTAIGFFERDGGFYSGYGYTVKCGDKWFVAHTDERRGFRLDEDHTEKINLYFAILFRMQFKWHVTLGYEGCPHLKFDCTPQGAREVFKLRDLPEGRQRRTALKHWVGEHSRKRTKSSGDDTEYIKVMDYLRGETKFNWNGMQCIIQPSDYDVKRYAKLHNKVA